MTAFNIICKCGLDQDYNSLIEAKTAALDHVNHNEDKKVFVDEINPNGDEDGNYQTGRYWVITKKK